MRNALFAAGQARVTRKDEVTPSIRPAALILFILCLCLSARIAAGQGREHPFQWLRFGYSSSLLPRSEPRRRGVLRRGPGARESGGVHAADPAYAV